MQPALPPKKKSGAGKVVLILALILGLCCCGGGVAGGVGYSGYFVDKGRYERSITLPCLLIDGAELRAAVPGATLREGTDPSRSACTATVGTGADAPEVTVSFQVVEANRRGVVVWDSAPEHAVRTIGEEAAVLTETVPVLGAGARASDSGVAFAVSNLVVRVTRPGFRPSPDKTALLSIALAVRAKIGA